MPDKGLVMEIKKLRKQLMIVDEEHRNFCSLVSEVKCRNHEYSKRHLKIFGVDFNKKRKYDANQAVIIQQSLLLRLRGPVIHRFGKNIPERQSGPIGLIGKATIVKKNEVKKH